jgi:hypothetical protein
MPPASSSVPVPVVCVYCVRNERVWRGGEESSLTALNNDFNKGERNKERGKGIGNRNKAFNKKAFNKGEKKGWASK